MSEIGTPLISDKNKNQHDKILHMNVSVVTTALPHASTIITNNNNAVVNNDNNTSSIVDNFNRVHTIGRNPNLTHFQNIDIPHARQFNSSSSMIGIIDDVKLLPPPISTSVGSSQPPPKKKWIRHYLLGEPFLRFFKLSHWFVYTYFVSTDNQQNCRDEPDFSFLRGQK